jgi:2',3'-cyclic-nucleotide 2'-phosphodiesterase (5'-nucleotidase family)
MRSTACKLALSLAAAAVLLSSACPALAASGGSIGEINYGLSVDDALWQECPVGDYIADAVRCETGAQAALIPSGLLKNALVGDGTVTQEDVADLFREDQAVSVYTVTAPELKELLEEGVSHWTLSASETIDGEASAYDGFLQISGLTVTADASAGTGDRIVSVALDGVTLDLTDSAVTVEVAMPASAGEGLAGDSAGGTLTELVRDYIEKQGTVETAESGRMTVLGAHARDIISIIPGWFFWFLLVLLVGANLISGGRGTKDSFGPTHSRVRDVQ